MKRAAALALALAWAAASPAVAGTVLLRVSATAHGPNVLAGEVLEGLPPEAARLPLKASGRPGGSVSVDAALAALKLRRAPGGPYAVSGAARCAVSVGRQSLPGATLRAFAQDYVLGRLSGSAEAELKPLGAVSDLELYSAPLRLQVAPLEEGQLRGNVVLRVRVLQEAPDGSEREAASVPVSFLVKRSEARLVATRAIRKGELLGPDNLALRQGDATYDERGFDSLEAVEGKAARAYIGPGKVLVRSLVEFPPLIKRGDVVRVLVRSGAVLLEASGSALRDAREGETLPVQMADTKKQLQARCVEAGVVVYEAR